MKYCPIDYFAFGDAYNFCGFHAVPLLPHPRCSHGHENPPVNRICWICGEPMSKSETVTVGSAGEFKPITSG